MYIANQTAAQATCLEKMGAVSSFQLISAQIPPAVFLAAPRSALVAEHVFFFKPVFVSESFLIAYRNRASKVDLYIHCSKGSKRESDVSFGFGIIQLVQCLNCVLPPIRKRADGRCLPRAFITPGDIVEEQWVHGFCCQHGLIGAVKVAALSSHPSGFVAVLGVGSWGWAPTCHRPCTFPGSGGISWGAKEMLRLPLQLAEGEQHFSGMGKVWLRLSVGFGKEAELVPLGAQLLLGQDCMSFSLGCVMAVCTGASIIISLFLPPDHYMQVLACKHDCVRELATRSGRISPIENFLPLHYDYLQFAYYRGKAHLPAPYSSCVLLGFVQVWFVSWDVEIFPRDVRATAIQWRGLKELGSKV